MDSQFGSIPGVIRTRVGYTGGQKANPTYHSLGDHTESVQIDFDPAVVSYRDLLVVFWQSHDPHAMPYSPQYKSAVFYINEQQEQLARETAAEIERESGRAVTTEILPLRTFYRAEDYHQKYYLRHNRTLLPELERYYAGDERAFTDSTLAARFNGYAGHYGSEAALVSELDSYGVGEELRAELLELAPELRDEAVQVCGAGE